MRKLFFLGFLLCLLLPNFSCRKKGCTDEKALNYNITANSDDGSCEYCEEQIADRGGFSTYIMDQNSGSEFYNQQILRIDVVVFENSYNDLSCGDGNSNCNANLTFTNLISKSMNVSFDLSVYLTTGWSWYYNYQSNLNATIPVGQSVTEDNFSTGIILCSDHTNPGIGTYFYSATYF